MAKTSVGIVGIDCATDPRNVGFALGTWDGARCQVHDAGSGDAAQTHVDKLAAFVRRVDGALLALDAPLGWPQPLAPQLRDHHAGQATSIDPDVCFRRYTDRFVKATIGKTPLEVGADRIARTAVAALRLLEQIRQRTGAPIDLGWSPGSTPTTSRALEVYPAGTLKAHGLRSSGYKRSGNHAERIEILDAIGRLGMDLSRVRGPTRVLAENDDDVLDALVCLLAAKDYLEGTVHVPPPEYATQCVREGWIWVHAPRGQATARPPALQA